MIIKDDRGNELLEIIAAGEETADALYGPITHCLAVIKIGSDYLLGWNRYRKDWEIFGGCREDNETLAECIKRECYEELGLQNADFAWIGLMHYHMAPGYFNPEWHEEYGGLYGISLSPEAMEAIDRNRMDKEEIEKLAFYGDIKEKEKIAPIDEKLFEYWGRGISLAPTPLTKTEL